MKKVLSILSVVTATCFTMQSMAQTVVLTEAFDDQSFEDTFDIVPFMNPDDPDGFEHFWEINDYGSAGIPAAPSSTDGSTTGLEVFVNVGGLGTADVVNFYTKESYTGNIRVSVDVYLNFVPDTSGTTENFDLGIFHAGDKPISWEGFVYAPTGNDLPSISDGYFFSMNSDGDSGSRGDIFFSEGFPNGSPGSGFQCGSYPVTVPEIISDCRAIIPTNIEDGNDPFFIDLFPAGDGVNIGSPGNRWVTAVMEYVDGTVTVSLNGVVVHTYTDPDTTFTEGKVMIGHEDPFGSNGESRSYAIWDNFKVEQLEAGTYVRNWSIH